MGDPRPGLQQAIDAINRRAAKCEDTPSGHAEEEWLAYIADEFSAMLAEAPASEPADVDQVERVARAIYEVSPLRDEAGGDRAWKENGDFIRGHFRGYARAALAAVRCSDLSEHTGQGEPADTVQAEKPEDDARALRFLVAAVYDVTEGDPLTAGDDAFLRRVMERVREDATPPPPQQGGES